MRGVIVAYVVCLFAITACGGGNSSANSGSNTPAATPSSSAPAVGGAAVLM